MSCHLVTSVSEFCALQKDFSCSKISSSFNISCLTQFEDLQLFVSDPLFSDLFYILFCLLHDSDTLFTLCRLRQHCFSSIPNVKGITDSMRPGRGVRKPSNQASSAPSAPYWAPLSDLATQGMNKIHAVDPPVSAV